MAVAHVRTRIANPAGRKRKRNRTLTRAQKLAGFGGKRVQNAAKHRKRSNKPRRMNSRAKAAVNRVRKTAGVPRHRRRKQRNIGELLSVTLGNPARRKRKMAATKKRRKSSSSRRRMNRRRSRSNPVHAAAKTHRRRRMTRKSNRRRTYKRNPGSMGQYSGLFVTGLGVVGGAVGSRLLTQMVLGANNTGPMGYLGNAIAGGILAWGSHFVTKNKAISGGIMVGTISGIILRLINDYSPYGSVLSQAGLGDYMMTNFVTPQRYTDALHSAQVQIPNGWAPTVVSSNAAPKGLSGPGLYGGASIY